MGEYDYIIMQPLVGKTYNTNSRPDEIIRMESDAFETKEAAQRLANELVERAEAITAIMIHRGKYYVYAKIPNSIAAPCYHAVSGKFLFPKKYKKSNNTAKHFNEQYNSENSPLNIDRYLYKKFQEKRSKPRNRHYYPGKTVKHHSNLGIISMILGIVGWILTFIQTIFTYGIVILILEISAFIVGIISLRESYSRNVFSIFGIALSGLFFAFVIFSISLM